jgi:hypothetical protein
MYYESMVYKKYAIVLIGLLAIASILVTGPLKYVPSLYCDTHIPGGDEGLADFLCCGVKLRSSDAICGTLNYDECPGGITLSLEEASKRVVHNSTYKWVTREEYMYDRNRCRFRSPIP